MFKIYYNKNFSLEGHWAALNPVPDGQVEAYALELWTRHKALGTEAVYIAQELLILAFRVLIKEGVIPHDQIKFCYVPMFKGCNEFNLNEVNHLSPDKNGRLPCWPKGFCDVNETLLDRMLD
jgi:hypothetical protein